METKTYHCPNCSAPLEVPLGEVEVVCHFCESRLTLKPDAEELEVVKTREEMKFRERVAVRKAVLEKELEQEESEKWRQAAASVAISVLPVVGSSIGRGLFRSALGRSRGCLGCGCLLPVIFTLVLMIYLVVG